MSELVVSLTTIPPRLQYLKPFVESLKRQKLKPDRLELNLPAEYKFRSFTRADLERIPGEFTVHVCEDVGPATKVLPTLQRYKGTKTTIVYCDDDRVYSANWLERLTYLSSENSDCAIADECMSIRAVALRHGMKKDWLYRLKRGLSLGLYRPYSYDKSSHPDVAEGFGGVLVKPSFFSDRVFDVPEECWAVDDIWLSANIHLAGKRIAYSSRSSRDKGRALRIDRQDIGRNEDALTLNRFDGLARESLNYRAVQFCINDLGLWAKYKHLMSPTQSQ